MKIFFTRSLLVTVFFCSGYFINAQSYIIPVVFHVLHQGGTENISDAQILDAMRILNEDYNKQNADTIDVIPYYQNNIADMQVEFRLANLDPDGNATNGIDRIYTSLTNAGSDSAKINQWNPSRYLNIWVVKNIDMGAAGYSNYPWSVPDTFPNHDGVMLISNYVGSNGTSNIYNSRTITHLVGHCLCLMHLFGDTNPSSCNEGDSVADTPPAMFNAPIHNCIPDTPYCVTGVPPNFQNFMGGICSCMFTNGQKARVHNCLESAVAHRDSLWALPNLVATGVISGIEATRYDRRVLSLFPNPCTTTFTIQLATSPSAETYFQLYDALGRQVKREEINSTTTTIHRNNLPSGIYFWQLTERNKILERGKVVME
jgi:hypothetical protein